MNGTLCSEGLALELALSELFGLIWDQDPWDTNFPEQSVKGQMNIRPGWHGVNCNPVIGGAVNCCTGVSK